MAPTLSGRTLATLATSLTALAVGACTSEVGDLDAVGDTDAIDAYLRSLPYLPAAAPGVDEGDRSQPTRQGDDGFR